MKKDVIDFIAKCLVCQTIKVITTSHHFRVKMGTYLDGLHVSLSRVRRGYNVLWVKVD